MRIYFPCRRGTREVGGEPRTSVALGSLGGGPVSTIASIIGVPDDPVVEAVRLAFCHEAATIEQRQQQRKPADIIEVRRMEWRAAENIIAAYETAQARR